MNRKLDWYRIRGYDASQKGRGQGGAEGEEGDRNCEAQTLFENLHQRWHGVSGPAARNATRRQTSKAPLEWRNPYQKEV